MTIILAFEGAEKILKERKLKRGFPQINFIIGKANTPDIIAYSADKILYTNSYIGDNNQAALQHYLQDVPEDRSKYILLKSSDIYPAAIKEMIAILHEKMPGETHEN